LALQPESTSATKARRIGIRIRVLQFDGDEAGAEESLAQLAIGFNSARHDVVGAVAAMTNSVFYRNISADHAFNCKLPRKNTSMKHVKVCSACGKPVTVASVSCLWCGQSKTWFSGRLLATLKARVLSMIGFLVKRGRTLRT
jgi:hypothetical protein